MPKSICKYPSCTKRIPFRESYCDDHKIMIAKQRYKEEQLLDCRQYQYLYKTSRWKRIRLAQLRKQPLCEECLKHGRITLANVADHIIDHKGDKELFYHGELQSLCWSCHSSKTLRDNQRTSTH